MSETEPRPSQRGHIPPVRRKVAFTALRSPRSTVIAPLALTEGTLKAYAWGAGRGVGGRVCGWCAGRARAVRRAGSDRWACRLYGPRPRAGRARAGRRRAVSPYVAG
ncbi:hypothetical protein GCM10023082_25500 [Streptomyces tremellae]|uniref:Uncharacterized protein n=1 Tax=Streptomyces tremellae TaxID=1124239 RepID=A0ABP7EXQ4_9ACTN